MLLSPRAERAWQRAAQLARAGDGTLTTAHLLVAVAGLAEAAPNQRSSSVEVDMFARQAIATAGRWAAPRPVEPEHLLVVLLDQASRPVSDRLAAAGAAAEPLRSQALERLGLPADHPPVPLAPLPPAGVMDNPALPLADLPPAVWQRLVARQERLPLGRVHSRADWGAITSNEARAAHRSLAQHGLTDDERCSLLHHHRRAVESRLGTAHPALARSSRRGAGFTRPRGRSVLPRRWRSALRGRLAVTRGWLVWFGNRRADAHAARFRWTVQRG